MRRDRNYWLGFLSLLFVVGIIYLFYQVRSIYGGDAGDLVSAIVTYGIPHPPGYPLYTSLGIALNNLLPAGTVAWKIAFLSSLPAILSLFVLYDLFYYLTGKTFISLISVFVLAFTYPFWLYSEVVEVFSLNNLFTIIILWCFFHFLKEAKKRYLFLGAYFLGLSLTHHHIILFLLPSLLFILFLKRKLLTRKIILFSLTSSLLGLIPYLFVFIAAKGGPSVNWMGQPTISNFFALLTRSTYGTFKAGAFIAHQPVLRLLDIWGFLNFAYQDFRIAGFLLFIIGAFYMERHERKIFYIATIAFSSFVFFLFYASFPLSENFIVGTFERFILPLYILTTFYICFGFVGLISFLHHFLSKFLSINKRISVFRFISIIFLIYPLGLFILNYPKVSILKDDFTAENFASDLLSSVPLNSIILMGVDTPLFDSQYVYYTDKKWQDKKLIHFHKLINPDTTYQVVKLYPQLSYPPKADSPKEQFSKFLEGNYKNFPIFSKQAYEIDGITWVPWGLLFRFYKNKDLPKDEYILSENKKIWAKYHDPLSGSLAKYKNLLLSDTIRFYTLAHQEIGFWAAKRGYNADAKTHLLDAEKLNREDLDSYSILAQVYIRENDCERAQEQIDFRMNKDKEDPQNYLLLSLNYALCRNDQEQAAIYQKLYEEKTRRKETQLKKL